MPKPLLTSAVTSEIPANTPRHKVHIGTSGYHYDDWVGCFYPPSTKKSGKNGTNGDKLHYYQKYFSFLEINQTFYQEPVQQTFLDLERRSKPGMLYAVKMHQDLSHQTHFDADRGIAILRRHAEAVAPLVETGRFYSFLIQLDERLAKSHKALEYLLRVASEAVRLRMSVHIEFRHRSWHQEYVLQTLKDGGVGICNTEIASVAPVFPLKSYATTDKGYVRYHGLNPEKTRNGQCAYLYSDAEIAGRVKMQWALMEKVESLAVVYSNPLQAGSAINAMENLRQMRNGKNVF